VERENNTPSAIFVEKGADLSIKKQNGRESEKLL